jgi:hypothetical protein
MLEMFFLAIQQILNTLLLNGAPVLIGQVNMIRNAAKRCLRLRFVSVLILQLVRFLPCWNTR